MKIGVGEKKLINDLIRADVFITSDYLTCVSGKINWGNKYDEMLDTGLGYALVLTTPMTLFNTVSSSNAAVIAHGILMGASMVMKLSY